MPSGTVYLRAIVVKQTPGADKTTLEETFAGFEIECTGLPEGRALLERASDALDDYIQEDITDEGDEDEGDDRIEEVLDTMKTLASNLQVLRGAGGRKKIRRMG